jgi:hypothetical protein
MAALAAGNGANGCFSCWVRGELVLGVLTNEISIVTQNRARLNPDSSVMELCQQDQYGA